MSMKKIINKNEKFGFILLKKQVIFLIKILILDNFRETDWTKGVILDEIVDESTRQITCASNKAFTDLSLTKTNDAEWGLNGC